MNASTTKFDINLHFDCDCHILSEPCHILSEMEAMEAGTSSSMPKDMKDKIFECKSMAIYNKWQERFSKFVNDNNREENLESIYAFFDKMSESYAASTLWQAYSCLNKFYTTYKGWNSFNDHPFLKHFLKKLEKESTKKKSLVLSKEDLFKFIETAPSDNLKFLVRKAVAIIGYFGGLRCAELANLNFSTIEIKSESISVFIRSSKTDPHGKSNFYFTIPKVSESVDTCPFNLIKMYVNAVSDKSGRFFKNFNVKSKSFSCQPMGRNTIAGIPKFMANFLDLETPEQSIYRTLLSPECSNSFS